MIDGKAGGALEPHLVYEDEDLLVVYKPHRLHCALKAGGARLSGGKVPSESSLASWVYERFPETAPTAFAGFAPPRGRSSLEGGLFHRLDYDTAGLVLFARSPACLEALLAEQEGGRIEKTYRLEAAPSEGGLAGSRPAWTAPRGIAIEEWGELLASLPKLGAALEPALGALLTRSLIIEGRFRPWGPRGARVACLVADETGKATRRHGSPPDLYRTELLSAVVAEGRLALKARIRRGFRHQIRAHLAWIRLPLLGDSLYGGAPAADLHLVATELAFLQPLSKRQLVLSDCQKDGSALT